MKERPLFKQLLEASSIGIHLVISTFVGFAIGYIADKAFGTFPYLTVIFLVLGIASGFRELLRIARQQGENDEQDN